MTTRFFPVLLALAALLFGSPAYSLQGGGWVGGEGSEAGGRQWLTYNNDYAGQRYSFLEEINAKNAASLTEVCRVQVAAGGSFHSGPLLIDGVLYAVTHDDTLALDPTNCRVIWKHHYTPVGFEPAVGNRGLAYASGRLFRGTGDGHLLALDARTGEVIWKSTIVDTNRGECLSAAPIAWNGLVILGTACGDMGARGRIMAFDTQTGREAWRFNTIPRGKEFGADTWKKVPNWTGGGGTWSTYTIDVSTAELFVAVGNPSPDLRPDARPGDNLFTNCILVLDARTGALKWWYQVSPNDSWDYDLAAAPMLYERKDRSAVVTVAGKDGYLYIVDRTTRKLLSRTPVTTLTKKTAPRPTKEGLVICPGTLGGVSWNGPAYDEKNHAVVVGAVDWCTFVKAGNPNLKRGDWHLGGELRQMNDPPPKGWITSVDAETGAVRWKYKAEAPVVAAVTPTAGGVVFGGDSVGNFLALDSANGEVLLKKQLNAALGGGIVTYDVGGRQYVAVVAGNVSRSSFKGPGTPSLIILALPDGHEQEGTAKAAAETQPGSAALVPADARRGRAVFATTCSLCHGARGTGGTGPSLTGVAGRLTAEQVEGQIRNPRGTMPRLYPGTLTDQDLLDVTAFVRGL